MNTYNIEQRKKRWQDFLNFSKDFSGPMFQIDVDYKLPKPWPFRRNITERIDWALKMYELYIDQVEWLRDDRVPCLQVYTGTEIFAEAFGCKVHEPEDNMPFALPLVHNAQEASRLKVPDLSSSSLSMLFEIADKLRDKAGEDAIFMLPDVQSPLDIAALIWEKTDFYAALIEEPEAVLELMEKVKTLLVSFFDTWFERYGKEFIAHFPYYYMNGGITLSEDEVGSMSPQMFTQFALPNLVELSEHYGSIGIHCCANARHQWENFLKVPNLKLINLVQPEEMIKEAYQFFAKHTCQYHLWWGEGEPHTWPQQYPEGARVVMQVYAADKDEAVELAERLWAAYGR